MLLYSFIILDQIPYLTIEILLYKTMLAIPSSLDLIMFPIWYLPFITECVYDCNIFILVIYQEFAMSQWLINTVGSQKVSSK